MIKKIWSYPRVKAVVFGLIAIILILSLVSYAPTDDSWNTASGELRHNWLGGIGAWSADILLQLMGQVAFLVPLAFLIFAVFLWSHLRWIKTRGIVLVFAFLLAMWLAADWPVNPNKVDWFKAGSGGFIGRYLHACVPVPMGIWQILLWALCATLFIFAFRLPALKITALTGKGVWWGLKKMPIHLPDKIKKPFAAVHIHHQIQKIKKTTPKTKIKAVKSAPTPVQEKEGMELPDSDLLAAPKAGGGTQLTKEQMTNAS